MKSKSLQMCVKEGNLYNGRHCYHTQWKKHISLENEPALVSALIEINAVLDFP
jgi:hypothetical protein